MHRKLTHSKFQIELSDLKLTDTRENSDFSDTFFSKTTFPQEMDLDKNMDEALGFISLYNSEVETEFPVLYEENDTISEATFSVLELQGKRLQFSFEFGLEEFPSWEKKLSELDLHFENLAGMTIYDHAAAIMRQTYPTVNYCFPAIHVETPGADEEPWLYFEKIINHYKDDAFLKNTVEGFESHNRNIMQPAVFWLYILKKIFEDAGYELQGDILADQRLQKLAVFSADRGYYKKWEPYAIEIYVDRNHAHTILIDNFGTTNDYIRYVYEVDLPNWGVFELTGQIFGFDMSQDFPEHPEAKAVFYLNDVEIYRTSANPFPGDGVNSARVWNINKLINTSEMAPRKLRIEVDTRRFLVSKIMDLLLIQVKKFDNLGFAIPTVQNDNSIDLRKAVPDITCGDFVTITKNWFNYGLTPVGKTIVMNRVVRSLDMDGALSLEESEIKEPVQRFQKGMTFLLKFSEVEVSTELKEKGINYTFKEIFHSAAGFVTENFKTKNDTKTIEINALPLPLMRRSGINTAHCYDSDKSKVYAVLYDGTGSVNQTLPPDSVLLPPVHFEYWKDWFDFRIFAVAFKWPFKAAAVKIINLTEKSKVYAYKRFHLIKSLIRTEIKQGVFEVEIETESKN